MQRPKGAYPRRLSKSRELPSFRFGFPASKQLLAFYRENTKRVHNAGKDETGR